MTRSVPPRCPRRTCTCTSPARCGTRPWSSLRTATASACPTRWSTTGRRGSRPPTRRAGSGSSGSTTWPGLCCAPRTTYDGWCSRPPRTTSPTAVPWLEFQVDPSGYAARFGGITAFTDLVLDAAPRCLAPTGLGMAVVVAANRTRHPLDARTLARLAARYAGRGVVGFGLSNDERRGHLPTSRRRSRSPSGAGLLLASARWRAARPRASAAVSITCDADRLGHGVRSVEDPPLLERVVAEAGVALEVCPVVQRVARGLLRPHLGAAADPARRRRLGRAGRRRPPAVRVATAGAVRHQRAAHGLSDECWPSWPGCRCGLGAPDVLRATVLAEIEAWLASEPHDGP